MGGGAASELVTPATLAMHEDNATALRIRGNIHWLFNESMARTFLFNSGAPVANIQDVVISMREAISITTLDEAFNPSAGVGAATNLVNNTRSVLEATLGAVKPTGTESWWHSSRDIMWQRESHWHFGRIWAFDSAVAHSNFTLPGFASNANTNYAFPDIERRWSAEDEIDVVTKRRLGSHETLVYNVFVGFSLVDTAMAVTPVPASGENPIIAVGLGYLKLLLKHN